MKLYKSLKDEESAAKCWSWFDSLENPSYYQPLNNILKIPLVAFDVFI